MNIEPNTTTDWNRLYGGSWKGTIEEDAFAHPAKFSRGLIRHIIEHAMEEGWLKPGDTVLDPFGGVALGALYATMERLNWVGMELEERFVLMGNRDIQRWENLYRAGGYEHGSAYLYHGDSRYLSLLLDRRANGCVSSPPYSECLKGGEGPGARYDFVTHSAENAVKQTCDADYGRETAGQLAAMKEGEFQAAVSSPPYAGSAQSTDGDFVLQSTDVNPSERKLDTRVYFPAGMETTGQLGAMPEGRFQAAVSSPPYETSRTDGEFQRQAANPDIDLSMPESTKGYGVAGLGRDRTQEAAETFWAASRQVIEQVYQVLTPGAHAIWVCKDFVRNGERVPFTHRWAELCVACGFEWLHEHRAWLTESYGTQLGFFDDKPIVKERKSFFRRLAEKNGAPHIDWESVLCFRKV